MNTSATPANQEVQLEDDRTALSTDALKNAFLDDLFYVQGKFPALATRNDYYMALAFAVRDRMLQRWISTAAAYTKQGSRTVAYLSAEFLMGPHLGNNLINLGIMDTVKGNLTLFMRRDELDAAWRWIDPIIAGWREFDERPKSYMAGSWGPEAASLMVREGNPRRRWFDR